MKKMAPGVSPKQKMGGMDGARKSAKKQITALLPANKMRAMKPMATPRAKRVSKMEKMDGPV